MYPPQRLVFRVAFHLFVSLRYKLLCRPSLLSANYSADPTSLCESLFPALSFSCSHMYHSPLCLWLSLPLRISSGVSAINCKPGHALSPTHTQKKRSGAHRNRNNCLQKNKLTISHTSLFLFRIFHGIFSVFLWIIFVVGIKTKTCQSHPDLKLFQRIFFLLCVYSHLSFELLLQAVLLSLSLSLIFLFSSITFQSLQITKSHTSVPRRSKHIMHCSAFRPVTPFPGFDVDVVVAHCLPFSLFNWKFGK